MELKFAGGGVYGLTANPVQGRTFHDGVERRTMKYAFAYSDEAFAALNALFHDPEECGSVTLYYEGYNEEGEPETRERTLELYDLYLMGGQDSKGRLVFEMAQSTSASEARLKEEAEEAKAAQAEAELAAAILMGGEETEV